MEFPFHPQFYPPSDAFPKQTQLNRPLIKVKIKYHRRESPITYALVDSGSPWCLFPAGIGEKLGIDIESGRQHTIWGIGGASQNVYFHGVGIIVDDYKFGIYAGFGKRIRLPLLGQLGFFSRYNVEINHKRQRVIIKPH